MKYYVKHVGLDSYGLVRESDTQYFRILYESLDKEFLEDWAKVLNGQVHVLQGSPLVEVSQK